MSDTLQVKLLHETASGSLVRSPATIQFKDGRIWFHKSPFALRHEVKAMAGSRWHGFDGDNPRKIWSVKDCFRNRFQLGYLMGEEVYEWFDRPLVRHEYQRPLMEHQKDLSDAGLTYHYQIFAATMGVGKSLSAQEVIERSSVDAWYWVGPKSSLPNIKREFRKWNFDSTIQVEFMTYERLVRIMDDWVPGDPLPGGVVFDESSRLKTWTSQRTKAAAKLSDLIRTRHRFDGFVILMSGTPAPKRAVDWWAQCEVCWPGFLREGSPKALEQRLAFMVKQEFDSGTFWKTIGWKDDERKCAVCGEYEETGCHELHKFTASKNEVAFMHDRLKGLVVVKHKKDCLSLPEKRYRQVMCKPSASVLRVAKTIVDSAPNAMTGMTLLRELSDGFQYREVDDGTTTCDHCPDACGEVQEWFEPHESGVLQKRTVPCPKCKGSGRMKKVKRVTREVACPKEIALRDLLDENEETGRVVIFAGFTGSVDRVCSICRKEGWSVVRCDGRGFQVTTKDGDSVPGVEALDYWADLENNPRVAFVAHPESGGMSLTLTEARTAVYWSNSWKPEYRIQSEDRIHRIGADFNKGCTIVDLIHLPTDERVLEIIRENRRLELMTLGEITDGISWDAEEAGS